MWRDYGKLIYWWTQHPRRNAGGGLASKIWTWNKKSWIFYPNGLYWVLGHQAHRMLRFYFHLRNHWSHGNLMGVVWFSVKRLRSLMAYLISCNCLMEGKIFHSFFTVEFIQLQIEILTVVMTVVITFLETFTTTNITNNSGNELISLSD